MSVRRLLAAATLLAAGTSRLARAQSNVGEVPDFLLPIGARTIAMGLSAVAAGSGSDALWWNPALVARGPREVALQLNQTLASQAGADAGLAALYTVPRVGAIGLSVRYVNFGASAAVADSSQQQTGTFYQQSTTFAATFAAPFGDRLAVGLTAKLLRISFPCTGVCGDATGANLPPETGALDVGAQYFVAADSALGIGVAVRNVGFKLQVNDTPQADRLPSRLAVGVSLAPKLAQLPADVRVRAGADVVWNLAHAVAPGLSVGGELSFKDRYELRGGYVANGPTGSAFTFGLGVSTGKLQIDFSRMLDDVSSQSGVTPTFVALRYLY